MGNYPAFRFTKFSALLTSLSIFGLVYLAKCNNMITDFLGVYGPEDMNKWTKHDVASPSLFPYDLASLSGEALLYLTGSQVLEACGHPHRPTSNSTVCNCITTHLVPPSPSQGHSNEEGVPSALNNSELGSPYHARDHTGLTRTTLLVPAAFFPFSSTRPTSKPCTAKHQTPGLGRWSRTSLLYMGLPCLSSSLS